MTRKFSIIHRFKASLTVLFPNTTFFSVAGSLSGMTGTLARPLPFLASLWATFVVLALLFMSAPPTAQATTTSQILIDDTVVVYNIPKGYTNAPQAVVNAIKDEYAVHAPISWVDFVAAYSPLPQSPTYKLSSLASERLVIFLEMGLITQKFSAKDFHKLNAPAIHYARSKDSPAQEYLVENCQLALSRPQILRNTNTLFTVTFLETFICPKETRWTQTIVSRFRVHNKIITVHQLCTSPDYKDILAFKKHYATTLANLRFR